MMRLVTKEDFIDVITKFNQRGLSFLLSKFTIDKKARTLSAFDTERQNTSHWWQVPYIQKRWNKLISGDETIEFKTYLVKHLLKNKSNLKVLSLGTGNCSNELFYAQFKNLFAEITCVDITKNNLIKAEKIAIDKGYTNMKFLCADVYTSKFDVETYDLIMFHSSLHHFKDIDSLFKDNLVPALKNNGMLFINEYVGANRLQYPKKQIQAINKALHLIPTKYKTRKATNLIKNNYYGSGLIRMYIADPSEAVESLSIMPVVNRYFNTIEEKSYGGNLLMSVFKDIAYNFENENREKRELMDIIFKLEDVYLETNPSDFIFGLYQKK